MSVLGDRLQFSSVLILLVVSIFYAVSQYSSEAPYIHAMADKLYIDATPSDVKNAKGLHLITQSTPNGQAVQILLEELKDAYGTEWTTTLINISTNGNLVFGFPSPASPARANTSLSPKG